MVEDTGVGYKRPMQRKIVFDMETLTVNLPLKNTSGELRQTVLLISSDDPQNYKIFSTKVGCSLFNRW